MKDHDELRRAAAPGRIRDLVSGLFDRARSDPARAGGVLSRAQRELRTLRSRQRRWVLDGLYGMVRRDRLLAALTGSGDAEVLWVGELVRRGLDPDLATEVSQLDGDFGRCADWDASVTALVGDLDPVERIALLGGVRPVVAEQILVAFGEDGARDFFEASNARGPVVLRANRARISRDRLVECLREQDIPCEAGSEPDAVVLLGRANLPALDLFKRGTFEVQDEGSQRLARLVEPTGLVVDLCAGAGGKTLALAALGARRLVACDVRERPLKELQKRASRAGVRVEVHRLGPGGELPPAVQSLRADRVLVDAPCTGTGVLRRHPEHRWQIDADRLSATTALQGEILERAMTLVKPGGRLIYGTCSVLPAENEAVVDAFGERHRDWSVGRVLRTAPHTCGTDGFYGAILQRT